MLTVCQGLGETGPRRNGRMKQNFPVVPIFRNIGTTSRVKSEGLKPRLAHAARAYPGFRSMKRLGVLLLLLNGM